MQIYNTIITIETVKSVPTDIELCIKGNFKRFFAIEADTEESQLTYEELYAEKIFHENINTN